MPSAARLSWPAAHAEAGAGAVPVGRLVPVLALVAFVLVLPRAVIDYGQSGDALNNANDALALVQYGPIDAIPHMIRWPPAFPLFTWLLAPIVPWAGHTGANLLAFASYLAALALFSTVVAGEKERVALTVLFALTPMLLLNAAVTQDFMCGLAAALASYLALSKRAYAVAGVLLGVGMALRITNGLLLIPALGYLWCAESDRRIRMRKAAHVVLLTAVVGLVLHVPFIVVSDLGWRYFLPTFRAGPFRGAWKTGIYNWLLVFGVAASAGILVVAALRLRQTADAIRRDWAERRPAVLFAALTILIYALLGLWFTMKAEYVMPAIPFLYLLFARWFGRRELVAMTVLIFSYAFVAVDLKGGVSGHRELTLKVTPGILVQDWQRRHELQELRAGIGVLEQLGRAVVLTGMGGVLTSGNGLVEPASATDISSALPIDAGISVHPRVGTMVHRLRSTSVFLVTSLSREHVELVQREGYSVYMFSEYAPSAAVHDHHYDPYRLRITVLPLFGREAFYRRSADRRRS